MTKQGSGTVGYILIGIFVVSFLFFGYDILFSEPDHQNGIIIEKIHVPSRGTTGDTPYGGTRRGNYFITTQKEEQWIAMVKTKEGELLQVHLHPDHYQSKNVGDQVHFKKYEGHLLHIQYFAHNEEED